MPPWSRCASAALKVGLMLVRKVRMGRDTTPVACSNFCVIEDQCWNAVTVTEGPTHSPHCESKPKLHFIRLLSLQRLSHHSINTPVSPHPNLFFLVFLIHENAQGPFQLSDVVLYFVHWRTKPHNRGSFRILNFLWQHSSEVFCFFLIRVHAK